MARTRETVYKVKLDTTGFTAAARQAHTEFVSVANGMAGAAGRFGEIATAAGPVGLAIAAMGGAAVMAGGQLVSFFTNATKGAIELAGKLSDIAAKSGINTDALQKLGAAARAVGGSTESAAAAVGLLQTRLQKAPEGFTALGLSVEQLRRAAPEQLLLAVSDRLKEYEAGTIRAAAGTVLLGKGAQEHLAFLTSNIREVGDRSAELGGVIGTDAVRALDALGDETTAAAGAWDAFKNQLGAAIGSTPALLQSLTSITEGLGRMTRGVVDNKDEIGRWVTIYVAGIERILTLLGKLGSNTVFQRLTGFALQTAGLSQLLGGVAALGADGQRPRAAVFNVADDDPLGLRRSGLNPGGPSAGAGRTLPPDAATIARNEAWAKAATKAREEWAKFFRDFQRGSERSLRETALLLTTPGRLGRPSRYEGISERELLDNLGPHGQAALERLGGEIGRQAREAMGLHDLPTLRTSMTGLQPLSRTGMSAEEAERRSREFERTTQRLQDLSEAVGELGDLLFRADSFMGQFASALSDTLGLIARARQGDYIGAGVGALSSAFRGGQGIGASGGSRRRAAGLGALQGAAVGAAIGTALIPVPVLGTAAGAAVGAIAGGLAGLAGHARGVAAELKRVNTELKDTDNLLRRIQESGAAAAIQAKALAAGLEIEGLDDYVAGLTDRVAGGITGLIDNFRAETEAGARGLGALFAASFAAIVRQRGIVGASDALREAFHRLMDQYRALGISVEGSPLGAIGQMLDLGADEQFRALAQAAQDAADTLSGLAGLGYIDESVLAGSADALLEMFDRMMGRASERGLSDQDAFRAAFTAIMGPLSTLLEQYRRSGMEIPRELLDLINRGSEAGFRPLTTVAEHQLRVLEGILIAVSGSRMPGTTPTGGQDGQGSEGEGNIPRPRPRGRLEGFAQGGYVPYLPGGGGGGQVIRVAEDEGESIVPDSQREQTALQWLGGRAGLSLTIDNRPQVNVQFQGTRADLGSFNDQALPAIARALRRNQGGLRKVVNDVVDDRLRQRRVI